MATTRIQPLPRLRPVQQTLVQPGSRLTGLALIMPALVLFYAALMPSEFRLVIADQTFYPPRLASILVLPAIIWRLAAREVRLTIWDGFVFFASLWMMVSFMVVYGPESGLLRGAALGYDVAMPYLIGRLSFRDATDLRRFLVYAAPGLFVAGGTLLLEVIAGQPLVRPAAAAIFGPLPFYENGVAVGSRGIVMEARLGILRATGPFSHPILAGVFLASFLPLYFASSLRKWPGYSGVIASIFGIFSVSSTAILAFLIGLALLFVDWFQRIIEFLSWKIFIAVIGTAVLAVQLASQNGIVPIITRYTFNSQSARYRRFIWEFGSESVANHPWFGIGFKAYARPDWMNSPSVDNHWLLLAIRFGVIPSYSLFIVTLAGIVLLSIAAAKKPELDRRMFVGLAISLFTVGLLGFSVALFSGLQAWFYMMMAIAISLGTNKMIQARRVTLPAHRSLREKMPLTFKGERRAP